MKFFDLFKNKKSGPKSKAEKSEEKMTVRMTVFHAIKKIIITVVGGMVFAWVLLWSIDFLFSYGYEYHRWVPSWTAILGSIVFWLAFLGILGGAVSVIIYYITRRRISKRKMMKIWLLISYGPIILFFLLVTGIWGYRYYQRKHEFTDKERLERITGMEYPDFKVARYIHGNTAFNGDYYDELVIEFEETPPGDFYQRLDSLATVKESHWSKRNGGGYSFNYSWGNGTPAPEGENEQDDMFIRIELEKGKKRARIEYGVW